MEQPYGCTLPDGTTVTQFFREQGMLDGAIRLERNKALLREIDPTPASGLRCSSGGILGTVACSNGDRWFYANAFLGELFAFDIDGNQIWSRRLPAFRSIAEIEHSGGSDLNAGELIALLDESGSIVGQVRVLREYVVVEYRTAQEGLRQAVYHRSGILIGVLGPWDGILLSSDTENWVLALGGGKSIPHFRAKEEARFLVEGRMAAESIRYAFALRWLRSGRSRPCSKRSTARDLEWILETPFSISACEIASGALAGRGARLDASPLIPVPRSAGRSQNTRLREFRNFEKESLRAGDDSKLAVEIEARLPRCTHD